jgi:hypothetical protein
VVVGSSSSSTAWLSMCACGWQLPTATQCTPSTCTGESGVVCCAYPYQTGACGPTSAKPLYDGYARRLLWWVISAGCHVLSVTRALVAPNCCGGAVCFVVGRFPLAVRARGGPLCHSSRCQCMRHALLACAPVLVCFAMPPVLRAVDTCSLVGGRRGALHRSPSRVVGLWCGAPPPSFPGYGPSLAHYHLRFVVLGLYWNVSAWMDGYSLHCATLCAAQRLDCGWRGCSVACARLCVKYCYCCCSAAARTRLHRVCVALWRVPVHTPPPFALIWPG